VPVQALASYGKAPETWPAETFTYTPFQNHNLSTDPGHALQYWQPGSMDSDYYTKGGM